MTRLYIEAPLIESSELELPDAAAHHVRTVLRLQADATLALFNHEGAVHAGTLLRVSRAGVTVLVGPVINTVSESPLRITLVQAISRGERMDYTLQKAVELGVHRIVPVSSLRTVVKLDARRAAARVQHWRGVVCHAAEQSGRSMLPILDEVSSLASWLGAARDEPTYVLHPDGGVPLARVPAPGTTLTLIAGPEGGFDPREIESMNAAGIRSVALGPRILRTETAALCALSVCQVLWGDLG